MEALISATDTSTPAYLATTCCMDGDDFNIYCQKLKLKKKNRSSEQRHWLTDYLEYEVTNYMSRNVLYINKRVNIASQMILSDCNKVTGHIV